MFGYSPKPHKFDNMHRYFFPKVISLAASVPGRVTMAGIDGAKTVVTWSWDVSQSLLYKFPVKKSTCSMSKYLRILRIILVNF